MNSDPIFELIKSLSFGERRGFVSFANRSSRAPEFLRLFHLLVSLDSYKESSIRNRLAVSPKKLSNLKWQLKSSLYAFFGLSSSNQSKSLSEISFLINELYQRNQIILAVKELSKGKKIAKEIEDIGAFRDFLTFESNLPSTIRTSSYNEDGEWLEAFDEEYHLYDRYHKMMRSALSQKNSIDVKIELSKQILQNELFHRTPTFYRSQERLLRTKINGTKFTQNWDEAILSIQKYCELVLSQKGIFPSGISMALKQMMFLPILHSLTWNEVQRDQAIFQIRAVNVSNEMEKAQVFAYSTIPQLVKTLETGDFEYCRTHFEEIINSFLKYESIIEVRVRIQFCFLLALFAAYINQFDISSQFVNTFKKYNSNHPTSIEYSAYFKVIEILIAISIRDWIKLDALVSGLERILDSKKLDFSYFKILSKYSKQLLNLPPSSLNNKLPNFLDFNQIKILKADSFQKRPFEYFDYSPWLMHLTTGNSMSSLLKEEYSDRKNAFLIQQRKIS